MSDPIMAKPKLEWIQKQYHKSGIFAGDVIFTVYYDSCSSKDDPEKYTCTIYLPCPESRKYKQQWFSSEDKCIKYYELLFEHFCNKWLTALGI